MSTVLLCGGSLQGLKLDVHILHAFGEELLGVDALVWAVWRLGGFFGIGWFLGHYLGLVEGLGIHEGHLRLEDLDDPIVDAKHRVLAGSGVLSSWRVFIALKIRMDIPCLSGTLKTLLEMLHLLKPIFV